MRNLSRGSQRDGRRFGLRLIALGKDIQVCDPISFTYASSQARYSGVSLRRKILIPLFLQLVCDPRFRLIDFFT